MPPSERSMQSDHCCTEDSTLEAGTGEPQNMHMMCADQLDFATTPNSFPLHTCADYSGVISVHATVAVAH